jgi:cytidyltransferase-like protein
MKQVVVGGAFDDLRLADFRFLDEAARRGPLHVQLLTDEAIHSTAGKPPKFPLAERQYLLKSLRFVQSVEVVSAVTAEPLRLDPKTLSQIPDAPPVPENPKTSRRKVVVTGCYDWFHSGHVRFFEECSELGDLYVVVGHDANIRLLKGEGHPLFPARERRYIVGTCRFVTAAFISSGSGWMDAEPEFLKLKPDIYAVNEDGDKPEKLAFSQKHGIEYKVLKRLPKQGLPRRESTKLRGF